MKIWNKFSLLARYYFKFITSFLVFYFLLHLIGISLNDQMFFTVAYIWLFTLQTPGVKEKMLVHKRRFSFLTIIVRVNYYLQLFVPTYKFPMSLGPAIVRSFSPLLFIFFLKVVGGSGNMLFALLGCVAFEVLYKFESGKKKTILTPPDDPEMPPKIPNAEIYHE